MGEFIVFVVTIVSAAWGSIFLSAWSRRGTSNSPGTARCRHLVGAVLTLVAALGLSGPALAQEAGDAQTIAVPGTEITLTVAYVPAGTFTMGSPATEAGREEDEGPPHEVSVSGFWMTVHEITHDQFGPFRFRRLDEAVGFSAEVPFDADAVSRPSPPYEDPAHGMSQGDHPATGMTRMSALYYARWLSEKTGRLFRLPTEAEWEYACRAGSAGSAGSTGSAMAPGDAVPGLVSGVRPGTALTEVAWFEENSGGAYHPTASLTPNAWGLHDLSGNVAEWVLDEYDAEAYERRATLGVADPVEGRPGRGRGVVRGGAFDDPPAALRCADRFPETAAWKRRDPQIPKSRWWNTDSPHVGFRLVSQAGEHDIESIRAYWTELLGGA